MRVRTLILMRHAKSDYPVGVPDEERPLAPRGERDAIAAGEWLGAAFPMIDEVVVSPARRARDTWSRVATRLEAKEVREDPRVYEDWGTGLGEVLLGLRGGTGVALLIGHNPGLEDLALRLAGTPGGQAHVRLRTKFPTSGIAVIRMREWSDVPPGSELVAFAVPRG